MLKLQVALQDDSHVGVDVNMKAQFASPVHHPTFSFVRVRELEMYIIRTSNSRYIIFTPASLSHVETILEQLEATER